MTYIYLNTYENGYLYVGSHTWDGPEGVLDPNYHGSSSWAQHFKWFPIKEEILEVVTPERKLVAEREWIEKYALQFGIAAQVKVASAKHGNGWTVKYYDGLLLNAHCNSAYQMHSEEVSERRRQAMKHMDYSKIAAASIAARSEDSYRKMIETKRANGSLGANAKYMQTSEVQKRACANRVRNGNQSDASSCRTPEARAKANRTRWNNAPKFNVSKCGVICLENAIWHDVRQLIGSRKLHAADVVGEIKHKDFVIWRVTNS